MLYDQVIDMRPAAELHSPSGLGAYRPGQIVRERKPIRAPDTNTQYAFIESHGSFGKVALLELPAGMKACKMAAATNHWRRHVFDALAPNHVDALTETVEATLDFIAEFGPKTFSLQGIQFDCVQAEHLAAVLRASSTWRDQIPGWNDALKSAVAAVNHAGHDPQDVLFGMV